MTDKKTIAVYDARAREYADRDRGRAVDPILSNFIAMMPKNGYVLDLGCGPADASAEMRRCGLRVDPVDARREPQ